MSGIYKAPSGYSFDGEPRLCLVEGGTTWDVRGGQPVMDAGHENGVLISLLTKANWWGNYVLENKYRLPDSNFDNLMEGPIIRSTLIDSEKEVVRVLQYLVEQKVVSKITASIYLDSTGAPVANIEIHGIEGTIETFYLRKHGLNWIRQVTDPAHARLGDGYR